MPATEAQWGSPRNPLRMTSDGVSRCSTFHVSPSRTRHYDRGELLLRRQQRYFPLPEVGSKGSDPASELSQSAEWFRTR